MHRNFQNSLNYNITLWLNHNHNISSNMELYIAHSRYPARSIVALGHAVMHMCRKHMADWTKMHYLRSRRVKQFEGILKPVFFFGDSNGSVRLWVAQVPRLSKLAISCRRPQRQAYTNQLLYSLTPLCISARGSNYIFISIAQTHNALICAHGLQ